MPATTKHTNPFAALLDAQVEAQQAGVCQDEVNVLSDIGEDIADLAQRIAERLRPCYDARTVTRWDGRIQRRASEAFSAEDIMEGMLEGAFGHLDAFGVILTAARLRQATPAVTARAA